LITILLETQVSAAQVTSCPRHANALRAEPTRLEADMRTLLITTASIAVMALSPLAMAQSPAPSDAPQNYTSSRDVVCDGRNVPPGTEIHGSDCTVFPTEALKTGIGVTSSSGTGSRSLPTIPYNAN
jgi:hypothetical protein